jgi:hypothetical protein
VIWESWRDERAGQEIAEQERAKQEKETEIIKR